MLSLLRERGIDVGKGVSRRVTGEMLAAHRLILVMEPGHKEALQLEFHALKERIFMLSEMAGFMTPVEDPMDVTSEAIADCLEEIDSWLSMGEARIVRLARGDADPV
jgi:protein-tyrosine-phosphatase